MSAYKTSNRFSLPHLGFGIGLRTPHIEALANHCHENIDWLEVITENYAESEFRIDRLQNRFCSHYPIVLHGVSLSLGSIDPLDHTFLKKIKSLAHRIESKWISDHLAWTGINGNNTHDLLPICYTEESLKRMVKKWKEAQDILETRLLIENPSTYVEFNGSTLKEYEFLSALAQEVDTGLLLDVNNIYVSCFNHGYNTQDYLRSIPLDRIVQYHVAGHTNYGTHIIDTHIGPVADPVWDIFQEIYAKAPASVLIEWDQEIPALDVLIQEVKHARTLAQTNEDFK